MDAASRSSSNDLFNLSTDEDIFLLLLLLLRFKKPVVSYLSLILDSYYWKSGCQVVLHICSAKMMIFWWKAKTKNKKQKKKKLRSQSVRIIATANVTPLYRVI